MPKHLNIHISGQVQGVFFREYARKKAQELGISGFVENLSDGRVYIEAEGEEENLKEFLNWCRKGPDSAEVERVEAKDGEIRNFKGFEIK